MPLRLLCFFSRIFSKKSGLKNKTTELVLCREILTVWMPWRSLLWWASSGVNWWAHAAVWQVRWKGAASNYRFELLWNCPSSSCSLCYSRNPINLLCKTDQGGCLLFPRAGRSSSSQAMPFPALLCFPWDQGDQLSEVFFPMFFHLLVLKQAFYASLGWKKHEASICGL